MTKQRRKMTPEEVNEQEHYAEVRSAKMPEMKFALMFSWCKGQCQGPTGKEFCENIHGKMGIGIHGKIILTPVFAKKPFLHCQKCGFEAIRQAISQPVKRAPSRKKVNPAQELLV